MRVSRCLSQFIVTGAALALVTILSAPRRFDNLPIPTRLVIHNYPLKGTSARAIQHSLRARGPADQRGRSRDAFTSWKISWRWPEGSGKTVDPHAIKVSLDADIVIPRISRRATRANPTWRQYHLALVHHELRHFQIAATASQRLVQRYMSMRGGERMPIITAHRIAQEEVARARLEDSRYDQVTDHGRSEGVRWAAF